MTLLAQSIEQMFSRELSAHGRAFVHYKALDDVLVKEFDIDGFTVMLYCNPAREKSVMAKVDAATLAARACFLCPEGLEEHQLTTPWEAPHGNRYLIRVNPYPIFNPHFTISFARHKRQEIAGHYADMLAISAELPDYTLFYNGPHCGASAPDHMHFQAVPIGVLPLQKACSEGYGTSLLWQSGDIRISSITQYVRGGYLLAASKPDKMQEYFKRIYEAIPMHKDEWEPRMNVLSWYGHGQYFTLLLLREESRPQCFFATDEQKILISPASVEMSGIAIVSDVESFRRITPARLRNIILEVSLNGQTAQDIAQHIRNF